MTDEMPIAERARIVEQVLDAQGHITLPASGWPGATARQIQDARKRALKVIRHIARHRPLTIHEDDDGSLRVYPGGGALN